MEEKLCFIDVETTGTDPVKNGIVQISGIIRDREMFNITCHPLPGDEIEDSALEMNHLTHEEIKTYQHPADALNELKVIFRKHCDPYNPKDKMFFYSYADDFDIAFMWKWYEENGGNPYDHLDEFLLNEVSIKYDYQYLRKWFEKLGDKYFGSWFWNPHIDIMALAAQALKYKRPQMPNFKLATVAQALGIEIKEDMLHDARYDVMLAKEVYQKVTGG